MEFSLEQFSSPLSVSEAGHINNLSKRQKVVKEIFESEQTYLSQLQTIVDLFLKPIRIGGLLPPNAISIIFSNIEGILGVNTELFHFMKQQSLGDAFSYLGPFLKMYASYSSNFQMAIELLERSMKRDQGFSNFIETQESRPECKYLKLPALLITPVQRIPRYKLLLDELLRHTKQTHIDYSKISSAAQQITAIASFINEYIRQHENAQKMIKIQASLSGGTAQIPGIIVPGRRFVKEGKLMKVCRRRPKERMIFLFTDILVYARPNVLDMRSFICRGVLPLIDGQVQVLLNDERLPPNIPAALQLTTGDNNSIVLFSGNKDETLEWFEVIQATIHELQNDILSSQQQPVNQHFTFTPIIEDHYQSEESSRLNELQSLAFPPTVSPIGGQMPMIIETPFTPTTAASSPSPEIMMTPSPTSTNSPVIVSHTSPVIASTSPTVRATSPVHISDSPTVQDTLQLTTSPALLTSTPIAPTVVNAPLVASSPPIHMSSLSRKENSDDDDDNESLTVPPLRSVSPPSEEMILQTRGTEIETEEIPEEVQERIPLLPRAHSDGTSVESVEGSKCCVIF